jgi:hypothetical protein
MMIVETMRFKFAEKKFLPPKGTGAERGKLY